MKKTLLVVLCLVMALTMVVGCAQEQKIEEEVAEKVEEVKEDVEEVVEDVKEDVEGPISIYFIPKNLGNPYFEAIDLGFQTAMEELGKDKFEYTMTGPATAEATSQIEYIDAAAQNKADFIFLVPNSNDACNTSIDEAREAGTKVFIINADIPGSEDHRDGAIMPLDFGPLGVELLDNCGKQIGYEGQFAILSATTDAPDQNTWIELMKQELVDNAEKYSKMELVDVVYGDDQPEKSTTEMEALLNKYPNLKAVIAPTTVGIAAAAKVVQTKGSSVKVSGLGLPSEMQEFVLDGTVDSFQLWNPPMEGVLAVYMASAIVNDGWECTPGATLDLAAMGSSLTSITVEDNLQIFTIPGLVVYDKSNIEVYAAQF